MMNDGNFFRAINAKKDTIVPRSSFLVHRYQYKENQYVYSSSACFTSLQHSRS